MSTSKQLFILFVIFFSISESVINPDGKAVLITGCEKGIGNRLAKELNQIGFKVYAAVRNTKGARIKDFKNNVTHPQKMVVIKMDVTKDDQVKEGFEMIKQDLANTQHVLWALINNAGLNTYFPLEWSTLDNYRQVFDVNVFGVVRMSRVFIHLLRVSKGRIINMVSIVGRFSGVGAGAYCMTKHAIISFTDVLRQEVSRFGIRVISIEPPYVLTSMFSNEALTQHLEKAWNQTSEEVREAYVDYSREKASINMMLGAFPMASTEEVVDDVIDAIVSHKPNANYRKYDIPYQLTYALKLFTPYEFSDMVMALLERMGPMMAMLN